MSGEQTADMKKVWGILAAVFLTLFPFASSAQIVISEIMYDSPALEGSGEHDWIEVFNAGASAVDISSYRFFEANTNHTLKSESDSASLPSGGYAVIASATSTFLADWPAFGGTLFDSSFNLNSSGELIGIRVDSSDTTHDFTYAPADAATNNGSSLHRTSASAATFSAGTPTPGAGSLTVTSSGGSDTNSNSDTGTSTTTTTTTTTSSSAGAPSSSYVAPPEPQIFADGGDNRTVIVAADTEFVGRAYNRKKETISERIRFLWNFGDGSTGEGQSVLHHFEYPGKYAVVLIIADNRDAASDRIIVTAEPARLTFATFPDGSVMIGNNAGRDLNLSSWIVRSFGRYFVVPRDSIILAGESLRIGEKTLGFRSSPEAELDYPNGALALRVGDSGEDSEPKKSDAPTITSATASIPPARSALTAAPPAPSATTENQTDDTALSETENAVSNIEDTRASSSQIAAAVEAVPDSSNSYLWWFGAVGLAVAGTGAVLASRRAGKREWKIIDDSEK